VKTSEVKERRDVMGGSNEREGKVRNEGRTEGRKEERKD
jgi:hypothetical protein